MIQGGIGTGTFIGPTLGRQAFLYAKINTLIGTLDTLGDLPKQHALLLLRGSIHLLLRHLLRQLKPIGLDDLWREADYEIELTITTLAIRVGTNMVVPVFNKALISLPMREGGLGIPNHAQLMTGLYNAAYIAAKPLIQNIQPSFHFVSTSTQESAKETLKSANRVSLTALHKSLRPDQMKAWLENTSYLGRQWLRVFPTEKPY